jgi:hypothetical protein
VYVGVPPFVGVAVNVTFAPAQIVLPGLAEMETLAATFGFTVMVIPEEVAVVVERQEAFEVITQVTTWLFVSVVEVNVLLLAPAFVPFTFH